MDRILKVLIVEDSKSDAKLVVRELRRSGFTPHWERVETAPGLREALVRESWQLVISDSSLPKLSVLEALAISKELCPRAPFIIVSGTIAEETAVAAIRLGASDYVTKDKLRRLGPAVARELLEGHLRETRRDEQAPKPPATKPRRAGGHLLGMSHRLLEAQEMERHRIGRGLHDQLGPLLTAIKLSLDLAQHDRGPRKARALAEAQSLTTEAMQLVRDLSVELSPTVLDRMGLPSAIRWLVDRHSKWATAPARVQLEPVGRLPTSVEAACFRVAQEALTNAERHASARQLHVSLTAGLGAIEIVVFDDGKGFDVAAAREKAAAGGSLGLLGMQEIASLAGGELEIVSAPGRGTTIRARFPVPDAAPR
jgi:signal transduction histidine kinase